MCDKFSSSIIEGTFLGVAFCDYLLLLNILALCKDQLSVFGCCSVRSLDYSERRTSPSKCSLDWLSKSDPLSSNWLFFSNSSLILLDLSLPIVIVISSRVARRWRGCCSHRWMHAGITMISVSLGLRLLESNYLFKATLGQCVLCAALDDVANKRIYASEGLSEVVTNLAVDFKVVVATLHLLWNKLKSGYLAISLTRVELQSFSSLSFLILQERTWPNSESSKNKTGASSHVYGHVTVTSE